MAKYLEIMKMTKFGTKSALFGYFWTRILKLLSSYLKSAPSNFANSKILRKKQKHLNLGKKMPYLSILGVELKKNYYQI